MVDVIRNEGVKLTAAILNSLAVAIVTVGVLTPVAVRLYIQIQTPAGPNLFLTTIPYICIVTALVLHFLGWVVLRYMDVANDNV